MNYQQLQYFIAIENIPSIGSITAKKLIAHCGSVESVFTESKSNLSKISGIGEVLANAIISGRDEALKIGEREITFIEHHKIQALVYVEKEYPERLRACDDSPVVLFVRGNVDFNSAKILSIVGTRKATTYGTELCEKIVADLAANGHNPIIVSGLAYGIDICAHKAALKNNLKTVAVMATGMNEIYPKQHAQTAKQIINQGAVVTDFTSQAVFDRKNFLQRNRIIAGLADATLVVESSEKGGALVTANIANSYNRDVLAFPGRVGDEHSKGCNNLIRTNKAALIECAADLEYILNWTAANNEPKQARLFDSLGIDETKIVNHLKKFEADTIDNIAKAASIPMGRLSAILLNLEFDGYIKSLPGKTYSLKKI